MIDNTKYEDLIRNGERVEWYGVEVPKNLLTKLVTVWSNNLKIEIDKLESTLSELRGTSLERRKNYIKGLKVNLQNAPYSLNGDVYLKKKKRIEASIEEEEKSKKQKKTTTRRKRTSKKTTTKRTTTKNSDLIFGKNKK